MCYVTAGWHGLSQEARRMQLLGCRAQLQATQQSYMLLSRAFTNWQQLVELRKRLETFTDTLQARTRAEALCASRLLSQLMDCAVPVGLMCHPNAGNAAACGGQATVHKQ